MIVVVVVVVTVGIVDPFNVILFHWLHLVIKDNVSSQGNYKLVLGDVGEQLVLGFKQTNLNETK